MITAALVSNFLVMRMATIVNSQRPGSRKLLWGIRDDKANREIIRVYRVKNPGGSLFRYFLISLAAAGIGAVVMFLKFLP